MSKIIYVAVLNVSKQKRFYGIQNIQKRLTATSVTLVAVSYFVVTGLSSWIIKITSLLLSRCVICKNEPYVPKHFLFGYATKTINCYLFEF